MAQAPAVSPDDLLARGRASYQSGRYAEAINDLRAAGDAILTPAQMQAYLNSGKFESLPKFETTLIYLAMAYAKLGRDAEAREQIQRLVVAEGIAPTYATLPLGADVADFEDVARHVTPPITLQGNASLAALRARGAPPTVVASAPPVVAPATVPAATQTTLTPEQLRELEQRIAAARAEAEKEAEQRIAAERAT